MNSFRDDSAGAKAQTQKKKRSMGNVCVLADASRSATTTPAVPPPHKTVAPRVPTTHAAASPQSSGIATLPSGAETLLRRDTTRVPHLSPEQRALSHSTRRSKRHLSSTQSSATAGQSTMLRPTSPVKLLSAHTRQLRPPECATMKSPRTQQRLTASATPSSMRLEQLVTDTQSPNAATAATEGLFISPMSTASPLLHMLAANPATKVQPGMICSARLPQQTWNRAAVGAGGHVGANVFIPFDPSSAGGPRRMSNDVVHLSPSVVARRQGPPPTPLLSEVAPPQLLQPPPLPSPSLATFPEVHPTSRAHNTEGWGHDDDDVAYEPDDEPHPVQSVEDAFGDQHHQRSHLRVQAALENSVSFEARSGRSPASTSSRSSRVSFLTYAVVLGEQKPQDEEVDIVDDFLPVVPAVATRANAIDSQSQRNRALSLASFRRASILATSTGGVTTEQNATLTFAGTSPRSANVLTDSNHNHHELESTGVSAPALLVAPALNNIPSDSIAVPLSPTCEQRLQIAKRKRMKHPFI